MKFAKRVVYFLFLITLSLSPQNRVLAALTDYEIQVKNGLPDNSPWLTVHCASGDTELGFHHLSVNQVFKWRFTQDYFDRTMYFCHFWWAGKDKSFHVFDYSFSWRHCAQKPDGNSCIWIVKEDGFYFQEQGFQESFPHPEPPIKLRDW